MREPSIDVFRGISILLMVFFTLLLGFSNTLPDPLVHNRPYSLHPGDFVLPMFLFASGVSIVYFRKKIENLRAASRAFFVADRFTRLAVIWFWLAPFTAGDFFEMDELMLSAVLFVPSYVIAGMDDRSIFSVAGAVLISYMVVGAIGALPDFSAHYLGGFAAAPFYLPVMLGGVLAGRNMDRMNGLLIAWGFAAALLLIAMPPYKMSATPSFMALSVFVCLFFFMLLLNVRSGVLEYLGRHPVRYWALMILLIVVPLKFYALSSFVSLPLSFQWHEAVLASFAAIIILFLISKVADLTRDAVISRVRKRA